MEFYMKKLKFLLPLVLIALAALLVISCGDDEDAYSTEATSVMTTEATTAETTAAETTVAQTATTLKTTVSQTTKATTAVTTAKITTVTTTVTTEFTTKATTKLTTTAKVTTVFTLPTVNPTGTQKPKDDVTPVIIIPGIMGSQLIDANGTLQWPPEFSPSAIGNLAKLGLSGGISLSAVSHAPVTAALSNSTMHIGSNDTYRELARALAEEFGADNVYFFGYDWRQDLRLSAIELYKFVEQVKYTSNDSKVNVVAHSMGGLVLSSYLTLCNAEQKTPSIEVAITAGTPFGGSEKTTAIIGGYGNFLEDYVDTDAIAGPASGALLSTLKYTLTSIAQSFPSVYTMIPTASYDKLGGAMHTAAGASGRVTAEWLASNYAAAFASIEHHNVVGNGKSTLSDITPAGVESYIDGDGTVVYGSACGVFSNTVTFDGASHGELVSAPNLLDHIVNCLK